ncbi:hypothetical protein Trydic_g18112 [Trypoxylus dichotomus]
MDACPPIAISSREMPKSIDGIPQRKSHGQDKIPNGTLRNMPLRLLVGLTKVLPVRNPKRGYCLVSLLGTVRKILKTLLLIRISDRLD